MTTMHTTGWHMLCAVVEEKEKGDKEVVWAAREKARLGYFFPRVLGVERP